MRASLAQRQSLPKRTSLSSGRECTKAVVRRLALAFLLLTAWAAPAHAADELVSTRHPNGEDIQYILTTGDGGRPSHAVVLMPGGTGNLNPRLLNGQLAFGFKGNFQIRSRSLFADGRFVTASSDANSNPERMMAIVGDLERRFGRIAVYVVGTSRSTETTMRLAQPLDGRVAGFVHTSSMNPIASFDTRGFRGRHLIVTHKDDVCRATRAGSSISGAKSYGTELIVMEGGKSVGEECEAFSHHGYNGIERETVAKIKAWMLAGKP
jgi:hypothetical protein